MAQNVLHLLGTARREGSGIARIVAALATGLDRSRYKVHAWFLAGDGPLAQELQDAGASVRVVDWPTGMRDPRGAWKFWCAIRREEFALVHQHFGNRAPRRLVRLAGSATIVFHAWDTLDGAWHNLPAAAEPGAQPQAKPTVPGADLVIATSRAVADEIKASRLEVIYPGVDVPEEPSARRPDGVRPPDVVLGMAGRLVDWKGTVYLIRALSLLGDEFPHCRLEIAGSGPEEQELKNEANRLGLAQRVQFLGWQPELASLLSRWDIYVQPSLVEPFGIAALEAMASGLPVVATSCGGLAELIVDGRTGRLAPPADAVGLAAALRTLLGDTAARQHMGANGRERARAHFTTRRMVEEISQVYECLLRARDRD